LSLFDDEEIADTRCATFLLRYVSSHTFETCLRIVLVLVVGLATSIDEDEDEDEDDDEIFIARVLVFLLPRSRRRASRLRGRSGASKKTIKRRV
jgi:hypothetical protein